MKTESRTPHEDHLLLAELTIQMLMMVRQLFLTERRELVESILSLGHEVHRREKLLIATVAGPGDMDLERAFIPMHFERIGDNIEGFARAMDRMLQDDVAFTERARREIATLLDQAIDMLEATRDVMKTGSRLLIRHVLKEGPEFESLATEFAAFHQQRLIQGLCQPKSSSIFLAMIDYLRGIERHQREVVQKMSARAQAPAAGEHAATEIL